MAKIEVQETGYVDRNDSAFPTLVRLDNGDIICGFSVGAGPSVMGGTHCAVSSDSGRTWKHQGVILEPTSDPCTSNHLRLSRTKDGTVLAYGQRDYHREVQGTNQGQELVACEAVFCRSTDGGRTWSKPQVLPAKIPGPYEISNPIVVTQNGRWLAPAATYHRGLYGETVVIFESSDQGKTWPNMYTVFESPDKAIGYLEQKLIECQPNRLLAVAWRQDFKKDKDIDNGFSFSRDAGRTWLGPYSTGIQGQTMTPLWLGQDRFLVLYNCRFGRQSVQMCLVQARENEWSVGFEGTMWDAGATLELTADTSSNKEIEKIQFGYPMPLHLDAETVLVAHWCQEDGVFGIRWTRLRLTP